jgi:hypothetical protein
VTAFLAAVPQLVEGTNNERFLESLAKRRDIAMSV